MPIVSPGGIVTPADSDGWDLTTDLATMATSIDSAVSAASAGANAFKGTASDRGLFTSTATPGMLWQDTNGIGMIWKRGISGWVPAVWRWVGTTAQRGAFTDAPDGMYWKDTDGSQFEWVRTSGVWRGVRALSGETSITVPDSTTPGSSSITFPTGYFATPPNIQLTSQVHVTLSNTLSITNSSRSVTSAGIRVASTDPRTFTINWLASPA